MEHLTYQEVARRLGVSPRHVRRMVEQGLLPRPRKLGKSCRFDVHELERALERLPRA